MLLVAFCLFLHAVIRSTWHAHLLKVLFLGLPWPSFASIPHLSNDDVEWKDGDFVLHLNRLINATGVPLVSSLHQSSGRCGYIAIDLRIQDPCLPSIQVIILLVSFLSSSTRSLRQKTTQLYKSLLRSFAQCHLQILNGYFGANNTKAIQNLSPINFTRSTKPHHRLGMSPPESPTLPPGATSSRPKMMFSNNVS